MRIKKRIMVFLTAFLMLSYIQVEAAPSAKTLSVTRYQQEKTNWCWAASAKMLGKYFGKTKTQSQICQYVKGNTNNVGASNREITKAMEYATGKNSSITGNLTFTEIKSFIGDKGKPIGMSMAWNSGGGHVLVMKGYTSNQSVVLVDPAQGCTGGTYPLYKLINGTSIQSGTGYYDNSWTF